MVVPLRQHDYIRSLTPAFWRPSGSISNGASVCGVLSRREPDRAARVAYWEARAAEHFAIVDSIDIEAKDCSWIDGKTWHVHFQAGVDALDRAENRDPIPA